VGAPAPLSSYRTVRTCDSGIRVYRVDVDGPSGVGLPCGKRTCVVCRPRWIGRAFRRLLDGVEWADPATLRVLTLTAPGLDVLASSDDLLAFNRSWSRRWDQVRRELERAAPGMQFARVIELQKRGAIHLHVITRGADALTLRRVRRFAVSAGFGPRIEWSVVRAPAGLARYLAGYLAKSRDVFPPGTRVLETSRRWSLADPEVARARSDGVAGPVDPDGTDWYGGPPPGVSWVAWAEGRESILADRRYNRRRRAREGLQGFEAVSRDRWARWCLSPRGEAARARQRVNGPAALSPRPDGPQAAEPLTR
jgi:hypothetical protein